MASAVLSANPDWSRYLTPSPVERELGLFCLGTGERRRTTGHGPERALGCHAAVLVSAGTGHLLHGPDRVLTPVDAPAVLWLFPGVLHAYRPDPPGWRQSWVLFDGPAATAYAALGHLDPARPVTPVTDRVAVERAFAKVLDRADDALVVPALHELVLTVTRAAPDDADARLVARLRELAGTPDTVAGHAARLGVSVSRLRAAARAAGSTPQEIVLTTRLNEAKALLGGTDLDVAAVARRVGYDDPAYFSRLFARRVGVPPRTFRRRAWV